MSWFDGATVKMSDGAMNAGEKFQRWGQARFAGSFTQGGMASYVFSPGGRRPGGFFGGGASAGSNRQISRLEKMKSSGLYNEDKIDDALTKAHAARNPVPKKAWGELGKMGKAGRVGGMMMKAGPMALITGVAAGAMTEGDAGEKVTAGIAMGIGSTVGWEVGSKAGMAAGAAIGSVIPVVGTAIGAVAGYLIGGFAGAYGAEQAVHGTKGMLDSRVEAVRKQREHRGWYGDTSAFDTQRAATMRQYSLQAMNQGMMSARSGLGHEGIMVHK